mgnify:CR=1 FL=1
MDKSILSKFNGKPLIEIPAFIPTIGFLEGDFGKEILGEYQERVTKDYGKASALNVLSYGDGVVKGSNPFAVVLMNRIANQSGLRVANQADLELAIKANALALRGQYEDTGLVLRSEDEPNLYLAGKLMQQIRTRNPNAKMPAMIQLSDLELVTDSSSPHQLAFKIKDDAEISYDLSVLNKDGSFSSEDIDKKTGLPTKTGSNGNRNLYTRNSGLSRLVLGRDLGLDSRSDGLAYSVGDGRVVLVSAEGTAQNYLAILQKEADKQKAVIDDKLRRAQAVMKGE